MRTETAVAAGALAVALAAGGFTFGRDFGARPVAEANPAVSQGTTQASPPAPPPTQPPLTPQPPHVMAPTPVLPTPQPRPAPANTAKPPSAGSTAPHGTVTSSLTRVCGVGSAQIRVQGQISPTEETATTDYQTDGTAVIVSNVDSPIQLDSVVVDLEYPSGPATEVVITDAQGIVLQPGATASFTFTHRSDTPPQSFAVGSFGYHTAGQPQCVGH
jgi:hypothetical protein